MRTTLLTLILAAAALAQPQPAQKKAAGRPVPIDNDYVRVVFARDAPGRKGALHKHDRDRVMIYLDPGDIDIGWEGKPVEH